MKYQIGIDLAKLHLDFGVVNDSYEEVFHMQVENSLEGIKEFVKALKEQGINANKLQWGMEATGIYGSNVLLYIQKKSIQCAIINGFEITNSLGIQRGKNDRVDAKRIGEYMGRFNDKLRFWEAPRAIVEELTDLLNTRERLKKAKMQLEVPAKEAAKFKAKTSGKTIKNYSQPVIDELKAQIKKADKKIVEIIKSDERLSKLYKQAKSVTGVGVINACHFITTTNEFKEFGFQGKKFACYAGVAPFHKQSGKTTWKQGRVSKLSNRKMNSLLTMAARAAIRVEGEFSHYYQRKLAEGKLKAQVINAVKNKIILRVFACVKEDRLYRKNYLHPLA